MQSKDGCALCVCTALGGHASGGRTNDLLLLELSGWTWSQPAITGTPPSPRSGAAMCVGHGRYLVIHGGRNNFVLDTAHVLDLMTRTWVEVRARVEQQQQQQQVRVPRMLRH
jgi:hypothetical protein